MKRPADPFSFLSARERSFMAAIQEGVRPLIPAIQARYGVCYWLHGGVTAPVVKPRRPKGSDARARQIRALRLKLALAENTGWCNVNTTVMVDCTCQKLTRLFPPLQLWPRF